MRRRRLRSMKLTRKEVRELIQLRRDLSEVERSTQMFFLFNEHQKVISDFEQFAGMVEQRIEAYEGLGAQVAQIRKRMTVGLKKGSRELEGQRSGRNEKVPITHESILGEFEARIADCFGYVEEYLNFVENPINTKKGAKWQPLSKAEELRAFLDKSGISSESKDAPRDLVYCLASVYERLTEINLLSKGRQYSRDSSLARTLGDLDPSLEPAKLTQTPKMVDKYVTTSVIQNTQTVNIVPTSFELFRDDPLKIKISHTEYTDSFTYLTQDCTGYIAYGEESSILATFGGEKMILKQNESVVVYSDLSLFSVKDYQEVVSFEGGFLVHNPNGQEILIKRSDETPPSTWLSYKPAKINYSQAKNGLLKTDPLGHLVGLNFGTFVVVCQLEPKSAQQLDSKPTENRLKMLRFHNLSSSLIHFFEILNDGETDHQLLTLTKNGLLNFIDLDFDKFGEISEDNILDTKQLDLDLEKGEECVGLAACERSKVFAVLTKLNSIWVADAGYERILVYGLEDGCWSKLALMTQLELRNLYLRGIESICFSRYFGEFLVLCCHSTTPHAVQMFIYDTKKRVLRLHESRALNLKSGRCWRLLRSKSGDFVYGMLDGGRVLRIDFELNPRLTNVYK